MIRFNLYTLGIFLVIITVIQILIAVVFAYYAILSDSSNAGDLAWLNVFGSICTGFAAAITLSIHHDTGF